MEEDTNFSCSSGPTCSPPELPNGPILLGRFILRPVAYSFLLSLSISPRVLLVAEVITTRARREYSRQVSRDADAQRYHAARLLSRSRS